MTATTLIAGPAGQLEILEERPAAEPRGVVVMCHPHPLFGGSMYDSVLETTVEPLIAGDLVCVRFNFRGVGHSEGSFGDQEGEAEDLRAVATHVRARHPDLPLFVMGYSFGAAVANRVLSELHARAVLLVAPPVGHMDFDISTSPPCPVHVIVGSEDTFAPLDIVRAWKAEAAPDSSLHIIDGADHFFDGYSAELAGRVEKLLREARGSD